MEFRRTTLANGLEIVAECNPGVHTAALGFFVRTGARDEPKRLNGVSHFLEHMAFKGTERLSSLDLNRAFDALGADHNAFTSRELTIYFAAVLPQYIEPALELLAELMQPALRPDDFESERKVILEEIRTSADEPPFDIHDLCDALHFGEHPLSANVLGDEQSLNGITVDDMREYWRQRYHAGNVVLAAAGRIDFDEVVRLAERYCGRWEGGSATRTIAPAQRRPEFRLIHKPETVRQYVVQMAAGPEASRRQRFAAELLTVVLADSVGSRLYWSLIDNGRAESASLGYIDYLQAGVFSTFLSCQPELAAENLDAMQQIFDAAAHEGLTAAELKRAKTKVRSRVVLGSEIASRRLFALGDSWTLRGEYHPVADVLAEVNAVGLDDIAEVLRQYPIAHATTVTIGPLEELRLPASNGAPPG